MPPSLTFIFRGFLPAAEERAGVSPAALMLAAGCAGGCCVPQLVVAEGAADMVGFRPASSVSCLLGCSCCRGTKTSAASDRPATAAEVSCFTAIGSVGCCCCSPTVCCWSTSSFFLSACACSCCNCKCRCCAEATADSPWGTGMFAAGGAAGGATAVTSATTSATTSAGGRVAGSAGCLSVCST